MKVLLDTCVILDYLQAKEPFFDDALNIMIDIANYEYEGYITASSMTDLYYIVNKYTHDDESTRSYISKLISLTGILDTTAEDCVNALHGRTADYEDAVMIETAARTGMDCIITRNTRDYSASRVSVLTPGEFLISRIP